MPQQKNSIRLVDDKDLNKKFDSIQFSVKSQISKVTQTTGGYLTCCCDNMESGDVCVVHSPFIRNELNTHHKLRVDLWGNQVLAKLNRIC